MTAEPPETPKAALPLKSGFLDAVLKIMSAEIISVSFPTAPTPPESTSHQSR